LRTKGAHVLLDALIRVVYLSTQVEVIVDSIRKVTLQNVVTEPPPPQKAEALLGVHVGYSEGDRQSESDNVEPHLLEELLGVLEAQSCHEVAADVTHPSSDTVQSKGEPE
jgi:hypothetical protein